MTFCSGLLAATPAVLYGFDGGGLTDVQSNAGALTSVPFGAGSALSTVSGLTADTANGAVSVSGTGSGNGVALNTPDDPDLRWSSGSITFAWLGSFSSFPSTSGLFYKGFGQRNYQLEYDTTDGIAFQAAGMSMTQGGGATGVPTATWFPFTAATSTRYLFVLRIDNTAGLVNCFVNGVKQAGFATFTPGFTPTVGTADLTLNAHRSAASTYAEGFHGTLDECA